MPELNVATPTFTAFFCDDIREEVSGQNSLIGLYGVEVQFSEFPAFSAGFAVYLRCKIPLTDGAGNVVLRLERGDHIMMEADFPTQPPPELTKGKYLDTKDQPRFKVIDAKLKLPPGHFNAPCTLTATCTYNETAYIAGKLRISHGESQAAQVEVEGFDVRFNH
ncbi:MAG: hypothetical protein ACO1PM_08030 [Acidovorax sp.]